jgi:hypothetical protein
LYSKSQKSKKSGPEDSTAKRKPSMLEQILLGEQLDTLIQPETESPDYIYEIEDENFEEKPLQEQPVESLKEDNPFLNYELSNFVEEGTQTIVENNERSFVEYEQLSDKESDVQLIDFDLRRAVIYSEILNAPYI